MHSTSYRAYSGSVSKQTVVDRAVNHREAKHYQQNAKYNETTGCCCLLGGALNAYGHENFSHELGVAPEVPHILEAIFEKLPAIRTSGYHEAETFAVEALNALPEDADTATFSPRLAYQVFDKKLVQNLKGMQLNVASYFRLVKFIRTEIAGKPVSESDWFDLVQALRELAGKNTSRKKLYDTLLTGAAYAASHLAEGHPLRLGAASYVYSAIDNHLLSVTVIRDLTLTELEQSPFAGTTATPETDCKSPASLAA